MNRLHAKLESYESEGELSRVVLECRGRRFYSLVIDIDSLGDLHGGEAMEILFKETEVLLATKESLVSASNAFVSKVKRIEKGKILSEVTFDFAGDEVCSLITSASLERLEVAEGKELLWFVKANEITLQRGRGC
ncbi:MAG: molybdopterin-binding protein [Sulfurimonadaceae bacterium]